MLPIRRSGLNASSGRSHVIEAHLVMGQVSFTITACKIENAGSPMIQNEIDWGGSTDCLRRPWRRCTASTAIGRTRCQPARSLSRSPALGSTIACAPESQLTRTAPSPSIDRTTPRSPGWGRGVGPKDWSRSSSMRSPRRRNLVRGGIMAGAARLGVAAAWWPLAWCLASLSGNSRR